MSYKTQKEKEIYKQGFWKGFFIATLILTVSFALYLTKLNSMLNTFNSSIA